MILLLHCFQICHQTVKRILGFFLFSFFVPEFRRQVTQPTGPLEEDRSLKEGSWNLDAITFETASVKLQPVSRCSVVSCKHKHSLVPFEQLGSSVDSHQPRMKRRAICKGCAWHVYRSSGVYKDACKVTHLIPWSLLNYIRMFRIFPTSVREMERPN
jgi:hypothetical protein